MLIDIVLNKLSGSVESIIVTGTTIMQFHCVLIQRGLGDEVRLLRAFLANVVGAGASDVLLLGRLRREDSLASCTI